MGIIAKDSGGKDFQPVPAGTHVATCIMVIDLGIQAGGKFKPARKIYLRWELPNEVIELTGADGTKHHGPMMIGQEYTLSLSEKANLRRDLESWRGRVFTEQELKGFDVTNVLGKSCMLGITHNTVGDKTYAHISAVMGLPKNTPSIAAINRPIFYTPEEHDQNILMMLPQWIQDKINNRQKLAVMDQPEPKHEEDFDDSIPF